MAWSNDLGPVLVGDEVTSTQFNTMAANSLEDGVALAIRGVDSDGTVVPGFVSEDTASIPYGNGLHQGRLCSFTATDVGGLLKSTAGGGQMIFEALSAQGNVVNWEALRDHLGISENSFTSSIMVSNITTNRATVACTIQNYTSEEQVVYSRYRTTNTGWTAAQVHSTRDDVVRYVMTGLASNTTYEIQLSFDELFAVAASRLTTSFSTSNPAALTPTIGFGNTTNFTPRAITFDDTLLYLWRGTTGNAYSKSTGEVQASSSIDVSNADVHGAWMNDSELWILGHDGEVTKRAITSPGTVVAADTFTHTRRHPEFGFNRPDSQFTGIFVDPDNNIIYVGERGDLVSLGTNMGVTTWAVGYVTAYNYTTKARIAARDIIIYYDQTLDVVQKHVMTGYDHQLMVIDLLPGSPTMRVYDTSDGSLLYRTAFPIDQNDYENVHCMGTDGSHYWLGVPDVRSRNVLWAYNLLQERVHLEDYLYGAVDTIFKTSRFSALFIDETYYYILVPGGIVRFRRSNGNYVCKPYLIVQGVFNFISSDGVLMWGRERDDAGELIYAAYNVITKERAPSYDIKNIFPQDTNPRDAWSDGEIVWVLNQFPGPLYKLQAFSIETGLQIESREIDLTGIIHESTGIWGDGETLYMSAQEGLFGNDLRILAINLETGERDLTKEINEPGVQSNWGDIWSDGVILYVALNMSTTNWTWRTYNLAAGTLIT